MLNRNLSLLLLAQLITELGNRVYQAGILWYLLDKNESTMQMSMYMVCAHLPGFLFGPLAGSIIDQNANRKWLLVGADMVSAVAVGLVVGVSVAREVTALELFLSTIVVAISNSLYAPTVNVVLPSVVHMSEVSRANAWRALTFRVSQIIGPMIAGIVVVSFGHTTLFAINLVSFIFSALLALGMQVESTPPVWTPDKGRLAASMVEGIAWIKEHKQFRRLFWTEALFTIALSPMSIIIPAYAKTVLAGSAGLYSLMLSLVGMGGIAAALLVMYQRGFQDDLTSIVVALGLLGVSAAIIGLLRFVPILLVAFFLFGFGIVIWSISLRSHLQARLPNEHMGRYFANTHATEGLLMPAGFLITGYALHYVTPATLFLVVAFGMLSAFGLALDIRKVG